MINFYLFSPDRDKIFFAVKNSFVLFFLNFYLQKGQKRLEY